MNHKILVERLFEALVSGDRPVARALVAQGLSRDTSSASMISSVLWPLHSMIEKLHRSDQMTLLSYHLSTRLLRMLVDQTAAGLKGAAPRGQTIFAACGPSQNEELAAQMACDLLEASGYEMTFAGGGVPSDEILSTVQERRPDILLLFASAPADLPGIRTVIDNLREIGACSSTRIVVGGGVFSRAEGLAEEIGANLYASDPADLVDLLTSPAEVQADAELERTPVQPAARRKNRMAA